MLRRAGYTTLAIGVALSIAALVSFVMAPAASGSREVAAQECPASDQSAPPPPAQPTAVPVAEVQPAVVAAPVRMPDTGTAGLLNLESPQRLLQDACPTTVPPTPVATVAAPTPAPTLLPGTEFDPGSGGGVDLPGLPGGGY